MDETSADGQSDSASEGPNVEMTREWYGQTAVLAVSGEIDMVTGPGLQKELSSALDEHPATLVVDLTDVTFFASSGLSALVAAYQQGGERTSLRVVAPSNATARPLQVTALDRKIPVFASRKDALDAQ